jgi:hypothetical protein
MGIGSVWLTGSSSPSPTGGELKMEVLAVHNSCTMGDMLRLALTEAGITANLA